MVSVFGAIGLEPWLRFVTGVIEVHSVRRVAPVKLPVAAIQSHRRVMTRVAWFV